MDHLEKQVAENAARRAEASFRSVLDLLPDAVIVHRAGKVVYVNATAVRVVGWQSAAAAVGYPVFELVHPDDRGIVRERIRTMMTSDAAVSVQRERIVRCDGTTIEAEVAAMPIVFDGEDSFLVVGRDVTERERMQAQLVQSERLASVGLLAAGVAHEINNPLAYLLPNAQRIVDELASERPDLAALRDCARDVLDGANRVRKIVRDLKAFARDDGGRAGIVDVNASVDAALSLVDHELRFRTRVVRDYGAIALVRANEGRLAQVFLNLLMNAAHAIVEGDAERNEVRVTTREAEGEVRVEIRDSGLGIAAEHLPRLFDPFFTTKAPGEGSGLGLSICHAIVASFGGHISARSVVGEGSTFTVTLPSIAARVEEPGSTPPAPTIAPSEARAVRPRVLLVDDERNLRMVLEILLAGSYDVVSVASGREALQRLRDDGPWDIVLCDLLMPDVTGMDLYEWIEGEHPSLASRVVFMTGGAFTPRARELLERVSGRWIEKPFEFDKLSELLEAALRQPRVAS